MTHRLYFKVAQDFKRDKTNNPELKTLHKLCVDVCTPRGRVLEYKETVGRIVVLDYNQSILSNNFNPSKFDFNPWDLHIQLEKGERDPEKTEKMIEKNPGGPQFLFGYIQINHFRSTKGTDWDVQP